MSEMKKNLVDTRYTPSQECRWNTYKHYRLILWAWMLNEVSIMIATAEVSHEGFYIHGTLHAISTIFIGIPLVYSEIVISQYTSTGVVSMWNFLPILRPMGYGTIFLVFLKTIYIMALSAWYLQYTFYAALDPPPWYSCDDFNTTKCMVKRVNVSIFQHCLEAQILFDEDCGTKTASNWFFERVIGDNNTLNSLLYCTLSWKSMIASVIISVILFILSLRKERFIQIAVKLLAMYVCIVILVLLCVALSTSGAWYATKITIDGSKYNFSNCYKSIVRGFLSVGTGYGIIGFLSRDVPFRSPATMTSITTPLFSMLVTLLLALIAFSGIKTMSYYHGEEENVIEMGISSFFLEFGSMAEILSYFDGTPIWGFLWFSAIFFCLFINLWILYIFLIDLILKNITFAYRHATLCDTILTIILCVASWPLFCSDITGAVGNAVEILQIIGSFVLSLSLYWIYGFKNHNVDIIFMIGIKASYFWKTIWILNPILILTLLYSKFSTLETQEYEYYLYLDSFSTYHDLFITYVIIGIYAFIVIIGILIEITKHYSSGSLRDLFYPTNDWGPKDRILFKSRIMFVPEIMTREFLYRQVRIYGYAKTEKVSVKSNTENNIVESSSDGTTWSILTSN